MTLKEFFESPVKLVIHTPTEEEAITLLQAFHDMGKTWGSGSLYISKTEWGYACENTCYSNAGTFDNIEYYDDMGIPIIEFSDITDFPSVKIRFTMNSDGDFVETEVNKS